MAISKLQRSIGIDVEASETSPMTPLRFRLDEQVLVKAAQLNASRYNMRILLFILTVGLLTSAYFIFERGYASLERITVQALLTVAGGCVVGGFVVYLLRALVLPMQVRKTMRQQKMLAEEMQLSWTDDELSYVTGKSQTIMSFKDLHGYRSSADVLMLYLTDILYYVVPVDAFGSTDVQDAFMRRLEASALRRL